MERRGGRRKRAPRNVSSRAHGRFEAKRPRCGWASAAALGLAAVLCLFHGAAGPLGILGRRDPPADREAPTKYGHRTTCCATTSYGDLRHRRRPAAAPSAAPTTSPAPPAPTTGRADPEPSPSGATPSAAPTITLKPTLQPTDKPTWELHASRGWRSGVLDILAKDEMHIAYTSNPMQSSAQCLHGNEMYLPARVLCDRQCMLDGAAVARASGGTRAPPTPEECAGPWYCARTDVCELFRNPEHAPGSDAGFDRRCTTIWGCANHSMCFPTEDAAAGMHIDFRKEDLAIKRRSGDRPGHQARWVSDPMELRYGGFTVRTTCCANDHDFAVGVDMPCNGAARATAFVGLALLLWGLWTYPSRRMARFRLGPGVNKKGSTGCH